MYLTELNLRNFKRFESTSINLDAPITLLLGPNSSGKSSIIKALLGLKQTASPSNEHEVFSAQGEYTDLGIYKDYVFNHNIEEKITIGITSTIAVGLFPNTPPKPTNIEFTFGYDFGTEQARLFEITLKDANSKTSADYEIRLTKKKTRDTFLLTLGTDFCEHIYADIFRSDESDTESIKKIWSSGVSVKVGDRYQFSPDLTRSNQSKSSFRKNIPIHLLDETITSILRSLDNDFFYLGPLRRSPARSYGRTAHLLSVGPTGEHTPSVLANLKSRAKKERAKDRPQGKRLEQLSRWVALIFPNCSIDAITIEELVKIEIEDKVGRKEVISDVGFGFSQVLPILVQIAVMPEDSTLLIEQPELHLHPSAQTKFSEVIAEASNEGRRFIIETHSEHFIRGLQLAVSNGKAKKGTPQARIPQNQIRTIYIPKAPHKAKEMKIDEWGEFIDSWPTGFFDEAYQSALKLMNNKLG